LIEGLGAPWTLLCSFVSSHRSWVAFVVWTANLSSSGEGDLDRRLGSSLDSFMLFRFFASELGCLCGLDC